MKYTIYHNPRCSKSRQTLALLEERGVDLDVVERPRDVAVGVEGQADAARAQRGQAEAPRRVLEVLALVVVAAAGHLAFFATPRGRERKACAVLL